MIADQIDAMSPELMLTVGIPAFNAAASIEAAVLSILRQSWRGSMEILVVDDGSTDDTVAIASRLAHEYGAVRVVRHDRNRGRPTARNTILREARGRYLTWMDADDEWYPNKLSVQFDALLADPAEQSGEPVICMCAFDWKWAHSTRLSHRVPDVSGDQLKGLLNGRIGAYLWTMLARTQTFRDVGEFDEKLPRLQDLDCLIRFAARGGRLMVSDPRRPLCVYHKSDDDKPGRVIAASLAHIWRKHYPLFRQYGRGFCRGSRRQHLLLAARHAFGNEGWWVGAGFKVKAAFASPGWLLAPIRARLRPKPPARARKQETLRGLPGTFEALRRTQGGAPFIDIVVSLARRHDQVLRSYLATWGEAQRAQGLWYVRPSIGLPDDVGDHAALLRLLKQDTIESSAGAARLLYAAIVGNTDGASSVLYLGAPIDLDGDDAAVVKRASQRVVAPLESLAALLAQTGLPVRPRLHLLVPDTETLLWRRYLRSLQSGGVVSFEAWLDGLGDEDAELLDHRLLEPLTTAQGYDAVHVHVLGAGSTLSQLVDHLGRMIHGAKAAVLPEADRHSIATPSRNQGLPVAERLLAGYAESLGAEGEGRARERLHRVPPSAQPRPASNEVMAWLATRCRLTDYATRFKPAGTTLHATGRAVPVSAEDLVCPIENVGDFERLSRDLAILSTAASLGVSVATSTEKAAAS